jgi:uncharacterized delta-60 repeat protein
VADREVKTRIAASKIARRYRLLYYRTAGRRVRGGAIMFERIVKWGVLALALGATIVVSACGGGSSSEVMTPQPPPPQPRAGTLDPTFGDGGIVAAEKRSPPTHASIYDIAIQPDGKIIAAGFGGQAESRFDPARPAPALLRYNTDGTLDPGFGMAGTFVGPAIYLYKVAVQPDGKILALGASNIIRINANGTLDPTFGVAGIVELKLDPPARINCFALQADGGILLGGVRDHSTSYLDLHGEFILVRLNPNGSQDLSFGQGAGQVVTPIYKYASIQALSVAGDGAILAVGVAAAPDAMVSNNFAIARYHANGVLDGSFGGGGIATAPVRIEGVGVNAIAVQGNGSIVVAGGVGYLGEEHYQHHFAMARFLASGVLDTSFGSAGTVETPFDPLVDAALGVAIQSNGKIVTVAGNGYYVGNGLIVARYDKAGSPDPDFGVGGKVSVAINSSGSARALAIQPDGRIVVAGAAFNAVVDHPRSEFALARIFGDPVQGTLP